MKLGALAFFAAFVASGSLEAAEYVFTPEQTFFYVEVRPDDGLLSKTAHRHVVRASKFSGKVVWDPTRPAACVVEVDIPVAGLVVDELRMRSRLKYKKKISDGDRKRVASNMRAEDQLFADKFGTIRFRASDCKTSGKGRLTMKGSFSVRGVDKAAQIDARFSVSGSLLKAKASVTLKHADFGMKPYSTGFGAISNAESITFHARISARTTD